MNTKFNNELKEFELYLISYENKSKTTILLYVRVIKKYYIYLINNQLNYLNITTTKARDFIKLIEQKYTNTSAINLVIYALRKFYSYLKSINKISNNPFQLFKTKSTNINKPKNFVLLNNDDMKKVITILNSKCKAKTRLRNIVICVMLFSTGIRVSELSNLKLENFNKTYKKFSIIGKGNKENIVYLDQHITSLVKKLIVQDNLNKHDYLIINPTGNKLSRQGISAVIEKYLSDYYPNISAHSFRYSYAMNLLSNGYDIEEISNLLRHSSASTTSNYLDLDWERFKSKMQQTQLSYESEFKDIY